VHFGEGGYSTMGQLIRQLLRATHPHQPVPAVTGTLTRHALPGVQAYDFTFG
jgi:hypothetical protein